MLLGFGEEITDDEGFTPVFSRKTKKAMRYVAKVRIGGEKMIREVQDLEEHNPNQVLLL
jgi:hypothetical protein